MALSAVNLLRVGSVDRHHARATGCDMRMVHGRQLHARLIVNLTLADIRGVKNVIFIVKPHQPILLLSNLFFLEVCAALAFIPLHLLSHVRPIILHQVRLCDVSVALRIRRAHSLAHAVVLRHISPLFGSTAIHTVIIVFSLSAILRIRLVLMEVMIVHLSHAVHVSTETARELYIILVKCLLDILIVCISTQFRKLHFPLLYNEGWQSPFSSLLVPLGFILYFVHLFVGHEVPGNLLQEI